MKEQIELIRKDLDSLYEYRQDYWNYTGCHNDIVRHLNVIEELFKEIQNTDDKYKNAWEYMFEWFNKKNAKKDTPKSLEIENFVIEFMQEIEKMNGIEVK